MRELCAVFYRVKEEFGGAVQHGRWVSLADQRHPDLNLRRPFFRLADSRIASTHLQERSS